MSTDAMTSFRSS